MVGREVGVNSREILNTPIVREIIGTHSNQEEEVF
jgi:hypothetical protein